MTNGGFDSNISPWFTTDTQVKWIAEDGQGCSTSGSLSFNSAIVYSPCISVSAGTRYNIGFMAKGSPGCAIDWYSDACSTQIPQSEFVTPTTTKEWELVDVSQNAPTGATHAELSCQTDAGPANLDRVYFSADPNMGF